MALEIRTVKKKTDPKPTPDFKEASAADKAAKKAEMLKQARANLARLKAEEVGTQLVIKKELEVEVLKVEAKSRPVKKIAEKEKVKPPKPTVKQWFQAIGILYGSISKSESGFEITLEQKYKFRLDVTHDQKYWFEMSPDKLDNDRYWQLYPQYVHYPNKPSLFYFKLVREATEIQPDSLNYEVEIFRLSGVMQELPLKSLRDKRMPVISVFRNKKAVDPKNKFRPQHIIFARPYSFPVKAFRYNPQAEKNGQMDKYFVDVKAKFDPKQEVFTFFEHENPPTVWVPSYKKYTQPDRKKKDKEVKIGDKKLIKKKDKKEETKEQTDGQAKAD